MNTAIGFIIAGIFLRLADIRYVGVDMLPDAVGMLLVIAAVFMLSKREKAFKKAYIPAAAAFMFSLGTLVAFLPSEPSPLLAALYCGVQLALTAAECAAYKLLFEGFEKIYGRRMRSQSVSAALYAVSRVTGAALTAAIYLIADETAAAWLAAVYAVWFIVNIVVTTYLSYKFYSLKPKFHG